MTHIDQTRPRECEPGFKLPIEYALVMKEMSDKHGVPLWLACRLVNRENPGWNPGAVSSRNADGSRDYGLTQINSDNVRHFADWYRHGKMFNPFIARDSIDMGLAHLAWLRGELGSWTNAVLAYNGGERCVKSGKIKQKVIDYAKDIMGALYAKR
jgi:soluble lytic murein transglycosylase-like protein